MEKLTVLAFALHFRFDEIVLVVVLEHVVVVILRRLGVRVRQRNVLAILHAGVADCLLSNYTQKELKFAVKFRHTW